MPTVVAEGYSFSVPLEIYGLGRFMAVVVTEQGYNVSRWIIKLIDGSWKISWEPGDLRDRDLCLYADGYIAPEFPGWELVKNPDEGKNGDVYVCLNPAEKSGYKRASTPYDALSFIDCYAVHPEYGATRPSRGWRIFRRKKLLGPVKLLPSSTFCKPLPLP